MPKVTLDKILDYPLLHSHKANDLSFGFSSGSVIFTGSEGQLSEDNSNFFWDNTNKRLGIGTTSPEKKLEVNGSGLFTLDSTDDTRGLYVEQYNDDSKAASIGFKRARGTKSSPSALSSGDNIGFFRSQGYDGTGYQQSSYFGFTVDGAVSSGVVPTALVIGTGTASYGTEVMRITSGGKVGIGTTGPKGKLDVAGGLSIGSYAGVNTPPSNGMIISDNVGIGTDSPTALLDINSDILRLRTSKTPASASAAGNTGDFCWDANYLYICVATNTWRRVAHNSW